MKKPDPVADLLRDALEEDARPTPEDDALLARAIDRAMARVDVPAASTTSSAPASSSRAKLALVGRAPASARSRVVRFVLPLAAAFAASVAFAAIYAVTRETPRPAPPSETVPEENVVTPAEPLPPASPVVAAESPEAPSLSVDDLPSAQAAEAGVGVKVSARQDSPALSAAELFREANAARRAGDVAKATELYRTLETRHPQAPEAAASRVSLGRILLDRGGDPAGALAQFDAYLKGTPRDGTLAEEARVGRALALQKLGRAQEERRAWQDLLEQHPASLYAERARARLAVLPGAASP